jgi:hypothetical protein
MNIKIFKIVTETGWGAISLMIININHKQRSKDQVPEISHHYPKKLNDSIFAYFLVYMLL